MFPCNERLAIRISAFVRSAPKNVTASTASETGWPSAKCGEFTNCSILAVSAGSFATSLPTDSIEGSSERNSASTRA
jgi:hypothetical protein